MSVSNQASENPGRGRAPWRTPQASMNAFWTAYTHKFPGKVHQILPNNPYAASKSAGEPKGSVSASPAGTSYDQAKAECVKAVRKIAEECRSRNLRYRDLHFDIEWDLKNDNSIPNCLYRLCIPPGQGNLVHPRGVKRVNHIFKDPKFYIDGPSPIDIKQGIVGDCWLLAALGAIGNKKGLIEKLCVDRDEEVGVYGFVFHRDGEWIHTIIDDKLYLTHADLDESVAERSEWTRTNRADGDEEYRKVYQEGSRALHFAQCTLPNETWLPLLEKAFAKAHGDYMSIDGGFSGEAVEDLTGGVTTELFVSDILDPEKFWTDELRRVNQDFLFGCATGYFDGWQGSRKPGNRLGIQSRHAYSIMEAVEIDGHKLLKIRNPWAETEWTGAWSDGSPEWNDDLKKRLNHKFGNDGVFWISYKDWQKRYHFLDRTRLFGPSWNMTQQWTSVQVPWSADYNATRFTFELDQPGEVVIVLSQLDDRYWRDFVGQYTFALHFRVNEVGKDSYIVRSHGNYRMNRSVSTEVNLRKGVYDVRMKITAKRQTQNDSIENVVMNNVQERQEKLLQVALSYDLAHAKGIIADIEEEKERQAKEAAKQEAKEMAIKKAKSIKKAEWEYMKRTIDRKRRELKRRDKHQKAKEMESRNNAFQNNSRRRGGLSHQPWTSYSAGQRGNHGHRNIDTQSGEDDVWEDEPDYPTGSQGSPSVPDTILTYNSSIDSVLDLPDLDRESFNGEQYPPPNLEEEVDSEQEEFAEEPWNAVCVVGLRIFTEAGKPTIKVVRPGDETATKEVRIDGESVKQSGATMALDLDDQNRGMSEDVIMPGAFNASMHGDGTRKSMPFRNMGNPEGKSRSRDREREWNRDNARGRGGSGGHRGRRNRRQD